MRPTAVVAALEHRMDKDDRSKLVGGFPEHVERGVIEHTTLALRLGADHRALETGGMRLAEHLGGARTVLQRNRRHRHKARLPHRGLRQMRIDQPRPGGPFRCRNLIGKHVEPATNHLAFDLLFVHPFQARGHVAQRL
jgi:hypothetical protein